MKKSLRMIMLITFVGIIGILLVYGNRGSKAENEIAVTSIVCNGSDVTEQLDLAAVTEIIGGANITKNKHENTGESQWVIEFVMDGESWTMELGVSEGDMDMTYGADGTLYKIKNGSELMEKLTGLLN
ncbi:MAG: hypothetical protein IJC91_06190 [Oscillospiraceae bacterium]|nr:hypothetical protein [Oscillospiraceae bacterium]